METKEGEKPIKRKYRGMTRKHMIIKNRSKGVKLSVKISSSSTSYLGVLARTMVPIRYKTWHVVPKQLKDKLWDSIEFGSNVRFSLNHKSRRNCMLTMGKCFRSFKNLLTSELLKRPPIQYTFIEDEDWTIFVKDRLSDNFKEYREIQKERRKRNIYNHHLSRKGYAGLEEEMMVASGSIETIDRSILWKKAREKKDGTFDEVAIPVIEKIDKLLKESQENGRSVSGSNDILVEALGTPEYSGRVRAKGSTTHLANISIQTSKEEQRIFAVLANDSSRSCYSQSDVSSSNMKQKQLLLPKRWISQSVKLKMSYKVIDDDNAFIGHGHQGKYSGGGTIILECGPNYLVVVDAPYDSSAPFPFLFWTNYYLLGLQLASKKAKKQKVNEVEVKSKGEKPQDMKNFETLVGLMLSTSRAYPINFPEDVFGESFKTFMMKEDMEMIISSKEVSSNCILYYICFHWVLVALEMKKMIAYYLDPMARQPCDDLKDIVNMAMRINPRKNKNIKEEPTWVKVVLAVFSIWIILGLLYYD
ncbi:hypothetical protein AAG906_015485 [Vitis piasezkii]